MIKLFNKIIDNKITPNGFYLLLTIKEEDEVRLSNIDNELKQLVANGLITDIGITEKGEEVINNILNSKKKVLSEEDKAYVAQYRELFPKGNLPYGLPARNPVKELEKKFLWFFNNYDHTWDTVLKATKKYIDACQTEDYKYMKTSTYFISKANPDKTVVSVLASWCDTVLDNNDLPDITDEGYNSAI